MYFHVSIATCCNNGKFHAICAHGTVKKGKIQQEW